MRFLFINQQTKCKQCRSKLNIYSTIYYVFYTDLIYLAGLKKATQKAKGNLIKIHLREGRTLHHDIFAKDGAGKVLLRSAPSGTGVIAGGPIRAACEVVGIKDIVAKSMGSSNPINVLRACIKGLKNQKSPKHIANLRGKKIAEVTKKSNS